MATIYRQIDSMSPGDQDIIENPQMIQKSYRLSSLGTRERGGLGEVKLSDSKPPLLNGIESLNS